MIRQGVLKLGGLCPEVSVLVCNRASTSAVQQELSAVRPYEEIPGPKPLPLIGNKWKFIPGIGDLANLNFNEMMEHLHRKYGNVVKLSRLGTKKDMVFLFDPKLIETAFRNEGQWPLRTTFTSVEKYRGETRRDFFQGIEGVIATQGQKWHDFRTRVNQPMMQPRNAKAYVGPIDKVSKEFLDRIRSLRDEKGQLPSDFIQHVYRWSLESIALIALDTRLGCLEPNLSQDSEPERMIAAVHGMLEAFFALGIQPFLLPHQRRRYWKTFVTTMDIIGDISMKYIKQAQEKILQNSPEDERNMSILETLLVKNDNPMYTYVMATDMLLGGIDTTGHYAAKTLHHLARNQDKQEILFEELKRILPDKDQSITAKDLEDMKYLKACFKEGSRLTPLGSVNLREMPNEVVIGNYVIPKGVEVVMGHRVLCRSEDLFPEPEKFIPERWVKGSPLMQTAHAFVVLPFGFGPRMCIGRRFAELEAETLVANIIRNFRVEHDEDMVEKVFGLSFIANPLNFTLQDRS